MSTKLSGYAETNFHLKDSEVNPNGTTDEQIRDALAAIVRCKSDPVYLEQLLRGAQDARRKINAEFLRALDAGKKVSEAGDGSAGLRLPPQR